MLEFLLNPGNLPLFACILILGTPLAAGGLFLVGMRRGWALARSPFFWVGAASGPALVVLWFMFNGILGLLGFDSIFSVFANLLLFCAVGAGIGAYLRVTLRKSPDGTANSAFSPGRRGAGKRARKADADAEGNDE
jgi:hypothetical protein